jgi:hypothetical protein
LAGIHLRSACNAGLKLGNEIGMWVVNHFLSQGLKYSFENERLGLGIALSFVQLHNNHLSLGQKTSQKYGASNGNFSINGLHTALYDVFIGIVVWV